jgi:hypothetical protein
MRRVWMGVSLCVALLAFLPAWNGRTSWWYFGAAATLFVIFLLEPWFLTWEIRRRGDALQITDDGVLRRLGRGQNEYVSWNDLREVSVVFTPDPGAGEEFCYLLAGSGKSGVMVNQSLAVRHDLLAHLAKLPGFSHQAIASGVDSQGAQRFLLWRARSLEGEAQVVPATRLNPPPPGRTLH